jgi:hypothetical protein
MRKRSSVRQLGLAALGVAAGAFVALPALGEPPTFTTRGPRIDVQRPHAPHSAHKPPPEMAPVPNDHPPHAVVNRLPQAVNLPITRVHHNISVVAIPHSPHINKGRTVITIVQVAHTKTFKQH